MAGYGPANYYESINKNHYNSTLKIEWMFPLT